MNAILDRSVNAFVKSRNYDCGPYGFVCDGISKLKLCDSEKLFGPTFLCPPNTVCNEESSDICENPINYIDPVITRAVRCHSNERIADPSVPNCKGYILCIPNKNRFQGIKFKCSGKTVFSGYTRTCTSPEKYKCPLINTTKSKPLYYGDVNGKDDNNYGQTVYSGATQSGNRPIDCKNYKFTVTQDTSPARPTYFCPSRPANGESTIRCTIFSNHFCMTLQRDTEDQFVQSNDAALRRPRKKDLKQ